MDDCWKCKQPLDKVDSDVFHIYNMCITCVKNLRGENVFNSVEHVNFFDLQRYEDGSHKSWCPVCRDGVLIMWRDPENGFLKKEDQCLDCGQRLIYDDIERVRAEMP